MAQIPNFLNRSDISLFMNNLELLYVLGYLPLQS
jgi:hypothetical protein